MWHITQSFAAENCVTRNDSEGMLSRRIRQVDTCLKDVQVTFLSIENGANSATAT